MDSKCIFTHLQDVHSVPYESIIGNMRQTPDTIIHSEVSSLVATMDIKVSVLSGAMALMLPFSSRLLGATHFS